MLMIDLALTMSMIDYCLFCSHLDLEIKLIEKNCPAEKLVSYRTNVEHMNMKYYHMK